MADVGDGSEKGVETVRQGGVDIDGRRSKRERETHTHTHTHRNIETCDGREREIKRRNYLTSAPRIYAGGRKMIAYINVNV